MSGFWYGIRLQFKLGIRNKSILITCYLVPLLFFAIMGGIFTSLMPEAKNTLIQSMTVMGVSMGALIGVPPTLVEIYGTDMKKMYKANGVPLYSGLVSFVFSAFIHLLIMSSIIFAIAPVAFDAQLPSNLVLYFASLVFFILTSLAVASVLSLAIKNQAKLTMFSQVVFLPSIMLSGILFPSNLLPNVLQIIGKIFPATWGYTILCAPQFKTTSYLPLLAILLVCITACLVLLKKLQKE